MGDLYHMCTVAHTQMHAQHSNYIVLSTFVRTLCICSYKEFAIGMTSYLPVHNGYAACTCVSKVKKKLWLIFPLVHVKLHLIACTNIYTKTTYITIYVPSYYETYVWISTTHLHMSCYSIGVLRI